MTTSQTQTAPLNKHQPVFKEIAYNGLWGNNPALVQLLGLCPLLAVTSTVVNAIGLGVATLCVLVGSNLLVSMIKSLVKPAVRLPIFVMIIAALVTIIDLVMQAYAYSLYEVLGIFIPLIVTNCAILGRADAFASKQPVHLAVMDGVMMGVGFLVVLVLLGAFRELLGQGTLLSDMSLLLGDGVDWTLSPWEGYQECLFIILPPGAFVAMGLLLALKNQIDAHLSNKKQKNALIATDAKPGAKRVRVTGNIS